LSFARADDGRALGGPFVIADLSVLFFVIAASARAGVRIDRDPEFLATTIVERLLGVVSS
jgi:hypothetical protein